MSKNQKASKTDYSKYFMFAAIIFIVFCGYRIARKKVLLREAASLPFYKVELEDVSDGTYSGKTYTSFLHLQLDVKIENHKIQEITVIENQGIDGEKARPIINKMIEENSIVVPAVKGAELGSLVYISCVSTALAQK